VIAGGESLVSHAGATLLVETARRSGLARQLSRLLGPWRLPGATHRPEKVVVDLAIAVALGGDAACDIAVVRAQPQVFGPVASDPTVSRLIARLAEDPDAALEAITAARAAARERVWNWAGAPTQDGQVVIDLDATLVTAHSEKQDATRTWKNSLHYEMIFPALFRRGWRSRSGWRVGVGDGASGDVREPDPMRQGHRPGPLPVPHVRHQRRLADRGHARQRPHRLDPAAAPRRRPRPGRGDGGRRLEHPGRLCRRGER
jgi:hypothetical protein